MGRYLIHYQALAVAGVPVEKYALTSGTAVYSDPIPADYSSGFASLLFLSHTGIDDVDISFQVSLDGKNFYDPVDVDNNALGVIFTAATADKWISFGPTACKWFRFKLDPDANSNVSVYYIQQEKI